MPHGDCTPLHDDTDEEVQEPTHSHGRGAKTQPADFVDPDMIGLHDAGTFALLVRVRAPEGVLHALTRAIFEHRASITSVDIARRGEGRCTMCRSEHRASITYVDIADRRQQRSTSCL